MKYCANCGTQLDDGAKFCFKCGAPQSADQNVGQNEISETASDQIIPGAGALTEADIVIKSAGSDKIKVIKVIREATGIGLKEAKDIVDQIAAGNEYIISGIQQDRLQTAIDDLTQAGADASIFAADNPAESVNPSGSGQSPDRPDKPQTEVQPVSDTTPEAYTPPVPADAVSQLDRQGTMDVLLEVKKTAVEMEDYKRKIARIKKQISDEKQKAEDLKHEISSEGWKKIRIITLIGAVLGIICGVNGGAGVAVFLAILFAVLSYIASYKLISQSDPIKHKEENDAKAAAYIREHVVPLQEKLEKVNERRNNLKNGKKYEWAIDVVGKDLFFSGCIKDLYDLVKSRRADNLKEALNKYDDEQHKARMREMQRAIQNASETSAAEAKKQTEYSRQAAASARRTEYNTRQTERNTRRFR